MSCSPRPLRGLVAAAALAFAATAPSIGSAEAPSGRFKSLQPRSTVEFGVRSVVIGVSEFSDVGAGAKLERARADAVAFAKALEDAGVQSVTLLDDGATRDATAGALQAALSEATPDEVVVLYLATHAVWVPRRADVDQQRGERGTYLLLADSKADSRMAATSLRVSDLRDWIQASDAHHVVLFADAAHQPLELGSGARAGVETPVHDVLAGMATGRKDLLVATASKAGQPSLAGPTDLCGGMGAFTCGLVAGFGGAADLDGDSQTALAELTAGLGPSVEEMSGGVQTAQVTGGTSALALPTKLAVARSAPAPQFAAPTTVEVCYRANGAPVPFDHPFQNGDEFSMIVRTPGSGHLRIDNLAPDGARHALFPAYDHEDTLVAAGTTIQVRPAEWDDPIVVTGTPGTETIAITWTRVGRPAESLQLADLGRGRAKSLQPRSTITVSDHPTAVALARDCREYPVDAWADAWKLELSLLHR